MSTGKLEMCGGAEFQCGNAECISVDFVCDGQADCRDSSDELKCGLHCLMARTQLK